jgi:multidrug efflux pump subunit AcrB
MSLARYSIERKAIMSVLVAFVLIGGVLAYLNLGRLEDPEFTIKEAVITTHYPGATAEQVEQEVTEPLETAIQQLKQLKEIRSISRSGVSIIFAEIQETYDKNSLPQVWNELNRKVNLAGKQLPPGSSSPVVNDDFGDVYGVLLALDGDGYSPHDLREIAKDLRRELLLCKDVGRIDFWGVQSEVVYIEIDRNRLIQLGLDPQVIFNSIKQRNAITETGKLKLDSQELRLRLTGDYNHIKDLEEQLISGDREGRMIRLKDIAEVKRGYIDPPSQLLYWNGSPAISLGISTVSGGDVIAMGKSISQRLEELKKNTPVGVEIHTIANQSKTVDEAVQGFIWNLISAVIIVVLLLVFFMGIREGVVIGFILLLTILATLICMDSMGITLQRISLGALIIALGMLVDNAIVIAEGFVIYVRRGLSRVDAAEKTVNENQWPLLGATGIAILAFAAITLSKDMTGEWLKSLFQVICISLGLSWLFAVTVMPWLCVSFLKIKASSDGKMHQNAFYRNYRRFVELCIDHRRVSIGGVLCLLLVALWGFKFVKKDFMPDMTRPQLTVDVWMPEGTHIKHTAEEVEAIANYISSLDGVTDVASFVGSGPLRFLLTYEPEMPSSNYGQLLVSLDDYKLIASLKEHLTAYLSQKYPSDVTSVDAFKLGPGGGAVVARLCGPETSVLRQLAEEVKSVMKSNPNARSIRTDWGNLVNVRKIQLDDVRSQAMGIGRPDIAQALAMNFSGNVVGVYRNREDLLPIILRPPQKQRTGIENIYNTNVWSHYSNVWVPLEEVTKDQQVELEDPVIQRLNRKRVLRVFCKQIHGTTDGLLRELQAPIESIELPEGYSLEWGGEHEDQVEANTKLMSNVPLAFSAMFLVSVLLFNSIRHPLIIFLGLPLAVIGVTAGMLMADKPFGFMATLGFLSLFGMLIKNEIVLLDQINLEIGAGKEPYFAVIDSATSRVRPVCMAAFTTVLGMLPLLRDAFFAPMAVTIMGGLTFATILTLVVVPVLYCIFFKVQRKEVV